jgi:hypothetical protein
LGGSGARGGNVRLVAKTERDDATVGDLGGAILEFEAQLSDANVQKNRNLGVLGDELHKNLGDFSHYLFGFHN